MWGRKIKSKWEINSEGVGWGWHMVVGIVLALIILILTPFVVDNILESRRRRLDEPEPPWPEGVRRDVPQFPATGEIDQQTYLVSSDDRQLEVTVLFPEEFSIDGKWSGSDATFSITDPYTASLAASTHAESWRKVIVSRPGGSFTPWIEVTFSAGEQYYHQWINAIAALRVVYPVTSGPATYVETSSYLERKVQFLVVSPEEIKMLRQHRDWEYGQNTPIWEDFLIVLVCAVPSFLVAFWMIIESLRKRRQQQEEFWQFRPWWYTDWRN